MDFLGHSSNDRVSNNISGGLRNIKITDYVAKQVTGEYGFKSFYGNFDFKEFTENNAPAANEVESPFASDMMSWEKSDVATAPISEDADSLF